MPCYKCSNGKYCQFDTLESCQAAERAIHARENNKEQTMATKPYKEPMKPAKKPKPGKM